MILSFLNSIATNNEDEWRAIVYRKGPEAVRAHLSLARKSITPKEKTWHLRRVLLSNNEELKREGKRSLSILTGVEEGLITNDKRELNFSLKILNEKPFSPEQLSLFWSIYNLIRVMKLDIPDAFSKFFKRILL